MHKLFLPKQIDEDIKLNSTVFHWPDHIQTVFEVCKNRLMTRREQAEDDVKKKVQRFEEKLNEYNKEVDSFRKKEVRNRLQIRQIHSSQ